MVTLPFIVAGSEMNQSNLPVAWERLQWPWASAGSARTRPRRCSPTEILIKVFIIRMALLPFKIIKCFHFLGFFPSRNFFEDETLMAVLLGSLVLCPQHSLWRGLSTGCGMRLLQDHWGHWPGNWLIVQGKTSFFVKGNHYSSQPGTSATWRAKNWWLERIWTWWQKLGEKQRSR